MDILKYFLLVLGSTGLFYFVDSKAENIFGIIAPFCVISVIVYIYWDLIKRGDNERTNR